MTRTRKQTSMRAGMPAAIVAAVSALAAAPARGAGGVTITDMTPSFPVGPYVALTVDPRDPRQLVVTTSDGRLGWTRDGGHSGDEAVVIAPREYLSAPLRSQAPLLSLQQRRPGGRTALSGLLGEAPGMRQFLWRLKEGRPVTRWQYWMSVENPATEVFDATVPGPERGALAATASGLFAADRAAGGWVRVVGLPQPRRGTLAAYAVTVDPGDRRRVLAGTAVGLLVSRDGTALATWRVAGGVVRVVIIREEGDRSDWRAYVCSDPGATVEEIAQGVADRWGIEQVHHDVKEDERIGQVQLRKVWANVGAFNLGLWVNSLVELWAWRRGQASLVDRSQCPWDDSERRASHEDRRKALQRELLGSEFQRCGVCGRGSRKIRKLFQAVVRLVA